MISNTTEIVSFSCHKGYSLTGASNSTCTIFGNWSDPAPNCDANTNESVSSPVSVIIGATFGGVLLFIIMVVFFANCSKRRIRMSKISKQKGYTAEGHEFMELNPMHATFDARKIRSTFLFDETSVDELQDLSQSALSPVSEMKDVEAARKIKISSSPYYAPLRNPDGSLYHSLNDDHAKVSGFSIPLVSAYESLKDHQGFYAFLPSEDNGGVRVKPHISEDLHLQPSNISVALVGERLLSEPTTINESRDVSTANSQIEISSSPYYASLRNPDGSLYQTLSDDLAKSSGFSIPSASMYESLSGHHEVYSSPNDVVSDALTEYEEPVLQNKYETPVLQNEYETPVLQNEYEIPVLQNEISSSPYYASLRNPDGSLYQTLSDDLAFS